MRAPWKPGDHAVRCWVDDCDEPGVTCAMHGYPWPQRVRDHIRLFAWRLWRGMFPVHP